MTRMPHVLCILVLLGSMCGLSGGAPTTEPVPAAAAVKQLMPDLTLSGATLLDALVEYQTASHAKITVDWDALRAASVTPQSKVEVKAKGLELAQVLDLTLANVQGAQAPLCWIITGGNIHVTSQAAILGAGRRQPALSTPQPKASTPKATTTQPRPETTRILLSFEDTPAQDAVAYFRQVAPKMNFFVAWAALESLGVTKDTPVTLKITQPIPMERALDLFVDTFNGGKPPLQQVHWEFRKNILSITTGEVLDRALEVRIYNVNDLLMTVPSFVGPQISIQRNTASGGGNSDSGSGGGLGSSGGGTGGGFGQSSGAGGGMGQQTASQDRLQQEQQLMEIIRNSIGEEYWQPMGKGSIRMHRGNMIISQTRLGFKLLEKSLGRTRQR